VRQDVARALIEVELLKLHNWRVLTNLQRRGAPGAESSVVKLFWSEMSQRLHDTAMGVLGPDGPLVAGDPRAVARGDEVETQARFLHGVESGSGELRVQLLVIRHVGDRVVVDLRGLVGSDERDPDL